jgi:CheY-like chemotaxis protein
MDLIDIPDLSNFKLLVAEDEESNFFLLNRHLQKTKAQVTRAVNGMDAIEIFSHNPDFDLVLMDIKMPEMDGFDALDGIRKINPKIIIVAQTAHAFADELYKIKSKGFNSYILKPINARELYMSLQKNLLPAPQKS